MCKAEIFFFFFKRCDLKQFKMRFKRARSQKRLGFLLNSFVLKFAFKCYKPVLCTSMNYEKKKMHNSIRLSDVKKLHVLLTNWFEILYTGFFGEIRWSINYGGASFIAENGNTYLKCDSWRRICQNNSFRGAIHVPFLHHISWKQKISLNKMDLCI